MATEGTEHQTGENQNTGDLDVGAVDTQQNPSGDQQQDQQDQQQVDANQLFADLDEDTRDWLTKRGLKDVKDVAKTAREQSKLLGNAIRLPGKDAPAEEVEEFYNKLGRPKTADAYELTPPASLPENLPYDGERAKSFKEIAHKAGLTAKQAAAIHDWAAEMAIADFNGFSEQNKARDIETANAETEKLVKLFGPLDGDQMKAEMSYADKALREIGGPDALAEFQRVGLIGAEGAVVKSAPIAIMLAKVGRALYQEDGVIRGNPDRLDNPFVDGGNMTAQMKLIKADKAAALNLIAAAGKRPEDFGIKA